MLATNPTISVILMQFDILIPVIPLILDHRYQKIWGMEWTIHPFYLPWYKAGYAPRASFQLRCLRLYSTMLRFHLAFCTGLAPFGLLVLM